MAVKPLDSQGREIKEGDRVAYNLSGDVVPGVVIGISPGHIKIRCESARYVRRGHISRVKNSRGVMVLAGISVEVVPGGSTWWQRSRGYA